MRIIALDIGAKRVGVALSDEMGWTAQGLTVLDRTPNEKFFQQVKDLVEEHNCRRMVVGLPMRMDGKLGPEAHRVLELVRQIKSRIDIQVDTWDERLTTVAVERVLLEADVSRKKRKKVVDKMAATYILQSFLDYLGSLPPGEDR